MLFDLYLSSWPCVIQYFPSPSVFVPLNHLTPDVSSHLAPLFMHLSPHSDCLLALYRPWILSSHLSSASLSSKGPSSSASTGPWTTSPPLWATRPSSLATWPATRRPLCAGWRTTPRWCRSRGGSRTDPCPTGHASASATWTLLTRATSSVWPPTPRAPCPRRACCSSSLVRERKACAPTAASEAFSNLLACKCHREAALCRVFYALTQTNSHIFPFLFFPAIDLAPFSNSRLDWFLLVAGSVCREKSGSNIVYPVVKKSPCLLFQIHSLHLCQEGQRKLLFLHPLFPLSVCSCCTSQNAYRGMSTTHM